MRTLTPLLLSSLLGSAHADDGLELSPLTSETVLTESIIPSDFVDSLDARIEEIRQLPGLAEHSTVYRPEEPNGRLIPFVMDTHGTPKQQEEVLSLIGRECALIEGWTGDPDSNYYNGESDLVAQMAQGLEPWENWTVVGLEDEELRLHASMLARLLVEVQFRLTDGYASFRSFGDRMQDPEVFKKILIAYLNRDERVTSFLDPMIEKVKEIDALYSDVPFTSQEARQAFGVSFSSELSQDTLTALRLQSQFQTVLVDDRDSYASARVDTFFQEFPERDTCSIMFGARHFPGMSERLLTQGYTLIAIDAERFDRSN